MIVFDYRPIDVHIQFVIEYTFHNQSRAFAQN